LKVVKKISVDSDGRHPHERFDARPRAAVLNGRVDETAIDADVLESDKVVDRKILVTRRGERIEEISTG
jgi:hypothetical protein